MTIKFKKVDYYWSDRWQKVINIYRCPLCGKDESDLYKTKPIIIKEHVCIK